MRIALITPTDTACTGNVGSQMITAGIRHLLRGAAPDASFVDVDMLRDDPRQWEAAQACDAAVLCGNPRLSVSAEDSWWEVGIWDRVYQLVDAGVEVLDGWGGACVGLDVPDDLGLQCERLLAEPRTRRVLSAAGCLRGAITRDRLSTELYARHSGVRDVRFLPCSSWYARREYRITRDEKLPDIETAIVLLALPGHEWAPDALRGLSIIHGRCPFIATTWSDYAWAKQIGLDRVQLVPDVSTLLQLYARTRWLISFRVHASIPAASFGAGVCTLAVDSRAQICEPFGLPVQPFTDLQSSTFQPEFGRARSPDYQMIIHHLRRLLRC